VDNLSRGKVISLKCYYDIVEQPRFIIAKSQVELIDMSSGYLPM